MHKSDQKSKTNTKTLLHYRQLNRIYKIMRSKEQNYQKAKKREMLQYYKKYKTIL